MMHGGRTRSRARIRKKSTLVDRKNPSCRKKEVRTQGCRCRCEVRGRRRESARPLTPVSGVAASAIRSKRNGENPIEGSCDRAAEDGTQVLGEREGRARVHREEREKKGGELEDMREGSLRDVETAAICAHNEEKCEDREDK